MENKLNDPVYLREIIIRLTDGVYNTSDTASFSEEDIELINSVRDYKKPSSHA